MRSTAKVDKQVRIYGDFETPGSLQQVAEGFSKAFPDSHRFPLFQNLNDLDEQIRLSGASARHALFVGQLSQIHQVKLKGKHEWIWAMVTPNSTEIGEPLKEKIFRYVDCVMTPSHWAQRVLEKFLPNRIVVAPHGVHKDFKYRPPERKLDQFTVLHLSSTLRGRKGTIELLEAWKRAELPEAQLFMSVPMQVIIPLRDRIEDLGLQNIRLLSRLDFTPLKMSRLYSSVHYVCQPSRGEGFGLVPLEARACGTPVIATTCTGHSEHMFGPGIVEVPTGNLAPIDDLPEALAPSLDVNSLADSLWRAYREYETKKYEARAHAESLKARWDWATQLKELRNELGKH